MVFYCRNCEKDIEVNDKEAKGYYNWNCPDCNYIAPKKDLSLGFGIVWNCDTGTTKRSSYVDSGNKTQATSSPCDSCKCGNK